jgi:hypothetical protein
MTTLVSGIEQNEAHDLSNFLNTHGISSHISGDAAYNSAGYKAAPKISILVSRKKYSKAVGLLREHYPQYLPKPEESVCKSCSEQSIEPCHDLAKLGLVRGLFTFFMIYMFHQSFCPSCGKLH